MKTIAVLTDFSENSTHATRAALHMAKKMKAKVLLFSISAVPSLMKRVPAGEQDLAAEQEPILSCFARRMEQELLTNTFPGSFLPEVEFDNDSTEPVDIMTSIMRNEEISLIVTAPDGENDLATFILSDACSRIIDWATVPVLVVPEFARLRNYEKIAFASQLHEEDINSIAELGSLLESFAPELMIAHLNSNPLNTDIQKAEESLHRDLYKKLDCGGVYFRSIPDTDMQKNWDWLKVNKRTDLLAIVQQPREQMARFFKRGQNKVVTHHLTLPVMILPKRP
ncbi:universal stress protein [Mucilaginibacter sp.]|uniref:universal stress protein n=1 Tax=Mucilaginibacter sp. TaxID=1882438 RepID=UPI00260CDC89|nr:universal stress protein [Mucilaginibacter sp.]MDB5032090.1 Nucleotide-binding universal stress protein UspA family [Mucilaginibacter sp.]